MATINGMYITVEDEDPQYSVDITDQPVERGIDVSDHVQRKPRVMSLSGLIVGPDAAQTREALLYFMENGSIVNYDGRNSFVGLIQEMNPKHNYKVADGFRFSMTLKEVRVAESSYSETLSQEIRVQVAPVVSAGRKQTKEKAASATGGTADLSFWEE